MVGARQPRRFAIVILVTDWKGIARARGLEIAERTAAPLSTLEETFRPLAGALGPEDEPATIFDALGEDE